jgi:hypothetical protein
MGPPLGGQRREKDPRAETRRPRLPKGVLVGGDVAGRTEATYYGAAWAERTEMK